MTPFGGTGHPGVPIRGRFECDLPAAERARIAAHAAVLVREDETLRPGYGVTGSVTPGLQPAPGLLIHDISPARQGAETGPSRMEYRALLLAGEGDVVAIGVHRSPAFEAHLRGVLGLEELVVHRVERASGGRLAEAAGHDDRLLERAAGWAHAAGHFTVRPYLASAAVWRLAGEIARRADVPVKVEGPPPGLGARVNDKIWFSRQAAAVLGAGAIPPSAPADDLDELVRRIRELGGEHEQIAVRLRGGSGGEGNLVIPTAAIAASPPSALGDLLTRLFGALDWPDLFPLQVAVWEDPVLSSPSAQLWVPAPGAGPPVVEGVFEQLLDDDRTGFAGVVTSSLPDRLQHQIATGATALATLFQELGYFGRCSFDAILVGEDLASAVLHWVECNGRWGGTSIPMTAVQRITGDWTVHPFVVLSLDTDDGPRVSAEAALHRVDDLLLRHGETDGVLLLSPTALETGQGLDLLAVARSRTRASELAEAARDRLLPPR